MTTDLQTPPPAWAQAIDRNRRPIAQGLLVAAGVLLVLAIVIWYKYRGEQAPVIAGCVLMAVAAACGGAWGLSGSPGVAGAEAARILVLIEGGVLGLALTVFTFWQMVLWWKDVAGGAESWRGENRWHLWVLAATGIAGLAIMFFSLLLARGEENANRTLRVMLYGYNAVLTGLLLLAVLIVINVIAYAKMSPTGDWTAEGMYTLDAKSQNVIQGLSQPLHVYVIEASRDTPLSRELHLLAGNLRSASDQVQVEYLLRDATPARILELAVQYKLPGDTLGVLLVYGSGDNELHQFIPESELAERSPFDPEAPETFKGEDPIISAIEFMEAGQKKPVVYFTQGNGELDVFGLDQGAKPDRRAQALASRMQKDHYEVKGLILSDKPLPRLDPRVAVGSSVPDDASIVIVAGPRERFTDKQLAALSGYMRPWFQITDATLSALKVAGLPDGTLEKLQGFKDKHYSVDEFTKEVGGALGREDSTSQRDLVFKHARREGKMMVLLDVAPAPDNPKKMADLGIEKLLAEFDVSAPGERVLRPDPDDTTGARVSVNPGLRNNPLATWFAGLALRMWDLRVIEEAPAPPQPGGARHQVDRLLQTTPPRSQIGRTGVFKESSLADPRDLVIDLVQNHAKELEEREVMTLPVGVTVSDPSGDDVHAFMRGGGPKGPAKPRLVVIGTSTFISDPAIVGRRRDETQGGSIYYDFFSSALAWLREKPNSIGVTHKDRKQYELSGEANPSSMVVTPFFVMLGCVVGLGLGVWVVRRR
jgi:hypothetical protein